MDVDRIQAQGPWVLIRPEEVKRVTTGGIYLPDGNLLERLGHSVGVVISAGKGHWAVPPGKPKGSRKVFQPTEVKAGDRVVFRGHLKEAKEAGHGTCFIHVDDLIGVLEDGAELDLALPRRN